MADTKKTLYHSELVKLSPLEARVTKNPTPSKYKKGSFFVPLLIDGVERSYGCETEACKDAFKGLEGWDVTITATGSREQAAIAIEKHGGPEEGEQRPAPSKPANKPAPAASKPSQPAPTQPSAPVPVSEADARQKQVEAWQMLTRHGNLMKLAIKRGLQVRNECREELGWEMPDAHLQGVCTSLYIAMSQRDQNWQYTMPAKPLHLKHDAPAQQ